MCAMTQRPVDGDLSPKVRKKGPRGESGRDARYHVPSNEAGTMMESTFWKGVKHLASGVSRDRAQHSGPKSNGTSCAMGTQQRLQWVIVTTALSCQSDGVPG